MAYKCTPKTEVLRIACLLFASLAILLVQATLGQQTDAGQQSVKPSAALVPSGSVRFLKAVSYDAGAPCANAIAVADVNGDGKPDALVAAGCDATNGQEPAGSVSVMLGNGDGTFRRAVTYNSGGVKATSVQVADVNGDGKPDLLVANYCAVGGCPSGAMGVLLGNGDGTFQPAVTYNLGLQPSSAVVRDVNGDGKPDLVVAGNCFPHCGSGLIGVMLGNGDGTFQPVVTNSAGLGVLSVAVADVNGDGKPDVLVGIPCSDFFCTSGLVGVLLGNGDGTFQPVVKYNSGGVSATSVAVADVNGDGKADLMVANEEFGGTVSSSVGVLLGKGDGTFEPAVNYASGAALAFSLAVGDVNGNGRPDLVVAHCTRGTRTGYSCPGGDGIVSILLGNGDGSFQAALTYRSGGVWARSVAVADVNGDGLPDLLVANGFGESNGDGTVGVLLNNTAFCTARPVITLSATPKLLWPPSGKMVPVTVSGTITDSGCTVTSAAYAVKDEYGEMQPSGPVTLGAGGAYSFTVLLQASRLGSDSDGRLYTITVSASNNAGKTGSQAGSVIVPHDQGH